MKRETMIKIQIDPVREKCGHLKRLPCPNYTLGSVSLESLLCSSTAFDTLGADSQPVHTSVHSG